MNKDRLLKLADAIENHEIKDLGFNMADWLACDLTDLSKHSCGTTACIAGHTVVLFREKSAKQLLRLRSADRFSFYDSARDILDLDHLQANLLFYPNDPWQLAATPAEAAKAIRYLANSGKVIWERFDEENRS